MLPLPRHPEVCSGEFRDAIAPDLPHVTAWQEPLSWQRVRRVMALPCWHQAAHQGALRRGGCAQLCLTCQVSAPIFSEFYRAYCTSIKASLCESFYEAVLSLFLSGT